MSVNSRQGLIDYCLRDLGAPVVEINVDIDQVEDRVDEAISFWREFHYDAVELVYLKQEMTANVIAQQYVEISDAVVGINKVFPFYNRSQGMNIFDVRYQILINDLYSLMSTDIIYYSMVKTQLELINQLLVGQKPIRYNKHANRLFIDMDWQRDVNEGDFIIVEAYRILDPDQFTDVYNDRLLKKLSAAYIKRQWATNVKKFSGVQLPGGVIIDGNVLYQEAQQEIKDIEQEIQDRFELPPDMFVG
jgi:hypothetical protein